jgi:hypothetical protein
MGILEKKQASFDSNTAMSNSIAKPISRIAPIGAD